MRIDPFNGLSPMTQSRQAIESAIVQFQMAERALKRELDRRQEGDQFVYGVRAPQGYTNYGNDFGQAVERAVREFNDPDAGYKVEKVYI